MKLFAASLVALATNAWAHTCTDLVGIDGAGNPRPSMNDYCLEMCQKVCNNDVKCMLDSTFNSFCGLGVGGGGSSCSQLEGIDPLGNSYPAFTPKCQQICSGECNSSPDCVVQKYPKLCRLGGSRRAFSSPGRTAGSCSEMIGVDGEGRPKPDLNTYCHDMCQSVCNGDVNCMLEGTFHSFCSMPTIATCYRLEGADPVGNPLPQFTPKCQQLCVGECNGHANCVMEKYPKLCRLSDSDVKPPVPPPRP